MSCIETKKAEPKVRKCDFGDGERLCQFCYSTIFSSNKYHFKKQRFCSSSCSAKWAIKHDKNNILNKNGVRLFVECEFCGDRVKKTGGHQKWCEPCVPRERTVGTQRWKSIASNYHLSKPQWEDMLKSQGGVCALCSGVAEVTDHCHDTGRVRSLLCQKCNFNLCAIEEGRSWVERAFEYLRKHGHKSK